MSNLATQCWYSSNNEYVRAGLNRQCECSLFDNHCTTDESLACEHFFNKRNGMAWHSVYHTPELCAIRLKLLLVFRIILCGVVYTALSSIWICLSSYEIGYRRHFSMFDVCSTHCVLYSIWCVLLDIKKSGATIRKGYVHGWHCV